MPKYNYTIAIYIFSILLINSSILGYVFNSNSAKIRNIKNNEILLVNYKLNNLNEELKYVINSLLTLSESKILKNYWVNNKIEEFISSEYLLTITNNQIYDQIRLINNQGMELIRVNFNEGSPKIVSPENLQNKKERYYFKESIKLGPGQVYISPLDLNIENNKIEHPIKPMIRIATPVYDRQNKKQGIVIINYLADHLMEKLKSPNDTIVKTLLINSSGYFFKGFNTSEEWLFMYPKKRQVTFNNYVGDFQDSVLFKDFYQFETKLGLFTSKLLTFDDKHFSHNKQYFKHISEYEHNIEGSDKYWSIIQYIPEKYLYKENKKRLLVAIIGLLVFNIVGIFVFLKINNTNKQKKLAYFQLEKSKNELEQLNQTKDRLYSILAHDLKNPFNAMIGFSEVLLRKYNKYDDKKRLELIQIVSDGINATYQLLENLLIWTKSQTGTFTTNFKPLNLHNLISIVIDECNIQSNKKSVMLENNIDKSLEICADYYMITTVARNLISNAIKFSFENSKVIISATNHETFVTVCIEDFGIGMMNKTRTQLFKSVKKTITSTNGTANEQGSGLGLILCKELIEIHKGDIWVESESEKGSRFYISLPKIN